MNLGQRYYYYAADRIRSWRGHSRAKWLVLQGAKLDRRVIVETGCHIDRPWGVTIGERSRLERRVWLKLVSDEARVDIGSFCFLGAGTELDVIDRVSVGSHTVIAPGCFITDHDHGISADSPIDQQPCLASPVKIGSDVWIGAGVCILRGVTIGDGAVVGAGAVVRRDISPYEIAVGVPTKIIGHRASKVRF